MSKQHFPFPLSDQPLTEILGLSCRVKVVDVGANPIDGNPPYEPLLRHGLAEIVGFEPQPKALATLQAAKSSAETYLPHVIGDGRRQELRLCQAPGMTSLLEPNPDLLKLFHFFPEWSEVVKREPVDTVRLDDVPETAGLDFLKIDIQGAEFMVFENAPNRLADALVVHTEVEFVPMYRDQPLFSDIDRLLRDRGFLLHRFEPLVSRIMKPLAIREDPLAGMSQLLWTDAIYVRDLTRTDALTREQLVKLAVILHECYGSYDLALRFLLAYDQREGTSCSRAYFDVLRDALAGAV